MQAISISASAVAYGLSLVSKTHEKLLQQGFILTECPLGTAGMFPYTGQCKPAAMFTCYETASDYITAVHLCHVVSSSHHGDTCECGAPLNGIKIQHEGLPFALVGIMGKETCGAAFKTKLLSTVMDEGTFEIVKGIRTTDIIGMACFHRNKQRMLVDDAAGSTCDVMMCNEKSLLICAGCNKSVKEVATKVCSGCTQDVRLCDKECMRAYWSRHKAHCGNRAPNKQVSTTATVLFLFPHSQMWMRGHVTYPYHTFHHSSPTLGACSGP